MLRVLGRVANLEHPDVDSMFKDDDENENQQEKEKKEKEEEKMQELLNKNTNDKKNRR